MWAVMGPILLCVWLGAINYSNNLVYFILYLLVSLSMVSFFSALRNLKGVYVDMVRIRPAFVSGDVHMDLSIRNLGATPGYSIQVYCHTRDPLPRQLLVQSPVLRALRAPGAEVEGTLAAAKRGLHDLKILELRSSYPSGLFAAHLTFTVNQPFYIYPKPEGDAAIPSTTDDNEMIECSVPNPKVSGDDFFGLINYQPGQPLRHVAWKAYARGRPLMVKKFAGSLGTALLLDESALREMPLEARLSQMTRWALALDEAQQPFGVRLGKQTVPPGSGPVHLTTVLQLLAIYRSEG